MKTECTAGQLEFQGLGRRVVVGQFDGGRISSDSGGLLLREVEQRTHILKRLAGCFTDHRNTDQIEHSLESLIKQRVMGLALGYEDLNDHDTLRHDPLLALLSDKQDLSGKTRKRDQDKGCALAGKSTLNRLELTPLDANAAISYLNIDFKRSIVTSDLARFAKQFADNTYHYLFEVTRFVDFIRWVSPQPTTNEQGLRVTLHYIYHPIAEFVIAMMQVTQVFSVCMAILTLAMPVFLLFSLVALVDGLVQRDLRRWGGGRESSFVYHLSWSVIF
jgi:hypothetical protein